MQGMSGLDIKPLYDRLANIDDKVTTLAAIETAIDQMNTDQSTSTKQDDIIIALTQIYSEIDSINVDQSTAANQVVISNALTTINTTLNQLDINQSTSANQSIIIIALSDLLTQLTVNDNDKATSTNQQTIIDSLNNGVTVNQGDAGVSPWPVADNDVLTALVNRYGGGKQAYTLTLSTTVETAIVTPAAGNAIRVYWVSAINRSPNISFPAATIRIGSNEIYKSSAISHWEIFEGAPDESVTAQLSIAGTVDITVHAQEFTP